MVERALATLFVSSHFLSSSHPTHRSFVSMGGSLLSILTLFFSSFTFANDIHIELSGLSSTKGQILYLLFNDDKGFPDRGSLSAKKGGISAALAQQEGLYLKDLPDGEYALSIFHDENNNGILDTNFIGMPKEAFGFSMNPKVYFGPPSFKKARFKLSDQPKMRIDFIHF